MRRSTLLWLAAGATALVIAAGTWLAGCPSDAARAQSGGSAAPKNREMSPGRALFTREFVAEEGLGPFFNDMGCASCHKFPLGGTGDQVETQGLVGEIPGFGCAVQAFRTESSADGPEPIPDGIPTVERTVPDLFGLGIVDGITDSDILAFNEAQKEFVGGRPHVLPDGRFGKFGRKAIAATLEEFNRGAFFIEMGITTPGAFTGTDDDSIPDPELGDLAALLAMDRFVRGLRLDSARETRPFALGSELFHQVQCSKCHVQEWSFTDILLHDIGTGEDDICFGDAKAGEFRTEPLAGLRRNRSFLHDGRARTIEEAILMHAGDAAESRRLFEELTPPRKAALMHYLRKL